MHAYVPQSLDTDEVVQTVGQVPSGRFRCLKFASDSPPRASIEVLKSRVRRASFADSPNEIKPHSMVEQ